MRYEPLKYISKEDVSDILKENNIELLRLLPLSIGEYCDDWRFAQDLCLDLTKNTDECVKANSMLGLSYIARNHNKLEKDKIKIAYKNLMKYKMGTVNKAKVMEALEDMYVFMKWKVDFLYVKNKILWKLTDL